jgi:hypothetical protein
MMYKDAYFVFDLYVDGEGYNKAAIFCQSSTDGGRKNVYYKTVAVENKKWQKVSIPVAVLIEYYDVLSNAMAKDWSHLGKLISLGWKNDAPPVTMYVGNMKICQSVEYADQVGVDFGTIWGNS